MKLSASVMTALAEPAEHPTAIVIAESRAAWSASCCSWFRCHSTDPVRRISAAEPISASIQTATMTKTWPSCRLRRISVLEPCHRLRVEGDRAWNSEQRVEDGLPLQLQVDHDELMSGGADRRPASAAAGRTAPARVWIAGGRSKLIEKDVDGARVDGAGERDGARQQGVGVRNEVSVRGRAGDAGRILVNDRHAQSVELMGAVGQRPERAWGRKRGARRGQRVGAAVVAEHGLACHIARRALEHRVDQEPSPEVDGGADEQKDKGRDQRKLDQRLANTSQVMGESRPNGGEGAPSTHHDVVARLDPEIVIPPPRMFRSLKP